MIEGYFAQPFGRPFLRATVVVPRLRVQWEVSFVVDTGADRTTSMPTDAARLGLDDLARRSRITVAGVGGYAQYFTEPGGLLLRESNGTIQVLSLEFLIAESESDFGYIPSFVGRDVLNRCRILYDPTRSRLRVKVVSSDAVIGAPQD